MNPDLSTPVGYLKNLSYNSGEGTCPEHGHPKFDPWRSISPGVIPEWNQEP